jgi:hypothetical protein
MRKLIFLAAVSAVLAGCAGVGGYSPRLGIAPEHNDRYWPPYDPNQAFPAQIMDGGSQD